MRPIALLFSAAFLFAPPLGASALSTLTVFCRANAIFVLNSTGCDITDPTTGVTARATGVASMSDLTDAAFLMSGYTSLSLRATPLGGDAQADLEISAPFYTAGSRRQGFISFDALDATASNPFQFISGRISIGDRQFGYGNGGGLPPAVTQFPLVKFAFTLGTESSFTLTARGAAGENCGCVYGPSLSANGAADVTFHLLEADGVTPVMIEPVAESSAGAIESVPEPGAFWPVAVALALGCLSRRKRARRLS